MLGAGTTVIPDDTGDLGQYMASLRRLLELDAALIYPAILVTLATVLVTVIVLKVVPAFSDFYSSFWSPSCRMALSARSCGYGRNIGPAVPPPNVRGDGVPPAQALARTAAISPAAPVRRENARIAGTPW